MGLRWEVGLSMVEAAVGASHLTTPGKMENDKVSLFQGSEQFMHTEI